MIRVAYKQNRVNGGEKIIWHHQWFMRDNIAKIQNIENNWQKSVKFNSFLINFFHHSILLFTIMVDKLESRNNFFSTSSFPWVPLWKRWFYFSKIFSLLKIIKQNTATRISTLNTGETNITKLTNYFILRMRVYIQNFTIIENGVKCRGKKFTYPKC